MTEEMRLIGHRVLDDLIEACRQHDRRREESGRRAAATPRAASPEILDRALERVRGERRKRDIPLQAAAALVVVGVVFGVYLGSREARRPRAEGAWQAERATPSPALRIWDGQSTAALSVSDLMLVLARPADYSRANLLSAVSELGVRVRAAWRECVRRGELPPSERDRLLSKIDQVDDWTVVFGGVDENTLLLARQTARASLTPQQIDDLIEWTLGVVHNYQVMLRMTGESHGRSEEDKHVLGEAVRIYLERIRAVISEGR